MLGQAPLLERNKSTSWRAPSHLMEGFSLPATPSKAKPRRGVCSFTTLLVVLVLVAGVAMFNQELGPGTSRTETYYRKALVAKMYFDNNGQTVTATSEEYSRSTVGGGTSATTKANKAATAGADTAGRTAPRAALELDDDGAAAVVAQAAVAAPEDDEFGLLVEESEEDDEHPAADQQQQQGPVAATVEATTSSDTRLTGTISATQETERSSGGDLAAGGDDGEKPAGTTTTVTVAATNTEPAETQQAAAGSSTSAAAATTAAAAAATQAAQPEQPVAPQQQGAAGVAVEAAVEPAEGVGAWWSDVVAASGEKVAKVPRKERDISASLASAVTFDENAVPDSPDCKIQVMDVDQQWGKVYGAGSCDLADERLWPFASVGRGIDGHSILRPEQYQYSMEYWITKAIRGSPRHTDDGATADFVFVDMNCYHSSWMAWLHPQNKKGRKLVPSPEYYIKHSFTKLHGMARFRETKGGDFGMVHPAPLMQGLFTEEMACEEMASVLNMVPERASLCVWTQDSHAQGKSVLLPYVAVSDIDMDAPVVPAAERETLIFFQGGCGNPDPLVRPMFAAGKMLRYALVQELKAAKQADIHAECACDICEEHMPHDQLMARMSRSVFCPILPSNTQSSRRLSEAMLTGCIPVFVGAPFHTLPLAGDIDYKSFALFVNVTDSSRWVNTSSPKWQHNHMISKAWKLDDQAVAAGMITVPRLADLVTLLRGLSVEEVAARHAGVVANRLKFWYPPASAQAIATSVAAAGAISTVGASIVTSGALLNGGGASAAAGPLADGVAASEMLHEQLAKARPGESLLGELIMRKMCHRAAAVQKRLAEARQQGLDYTDSDEKLEHPSLVAQQAVGEAPAVEQEQELAEQVAGEKMHTSKEQELDAEHQDATEWGEEADEDNAAAAIGGGGRRGKLATASKARGSSKRAVSKRQLLCT